MSLISEPQTERERKALEALVCMWNQFALRRYVPDARYSGGTREELWSGCLGTLEWAEEFLFSEGLIDRYGRVNEDAYAELVLGPEG